MRSGGKCGRYIHGEGVLRAWNSEVAVPQANKKVPVSALQQYLRAAEDQKFGAIRRQLLEDKILGQEKDEAVCLPRRYGDIIKYNYSPRSGQLDGPINQADLYGARLRKAESHSVS